MSKNIKIKQDGTAQTFSNTSVIGLRADDGSGDWIPEDEVATTVKHITLNGQYRAQERDGVKGYTAVFINVPVKSITGKMYDGNTYEVSLDGQGNIVKRQING